MQNPIQPCYRSRPGQSRGLCLPCSPHLQIGTCKTNTKTNSRIYGWLLKWDPIWSAGHREIVKIFANKLHPMNLYQLRYFRESEEDMYRVQIWTDEDGALKLRKVTIGSYKDYGDGKPLGRRHSWTTRYFSSPCSAKKNSSALFHTVVTFHRKIVGLSRKYQWQGAVLPLALDFHTYVHCRRRSPHRSGAMGITWFCNPITDLAIHRGIASTPLLPPPPLPLRGHRMPIAPQPSVSPSIKEPPAGPAAAGSTCARILHLRIMDFGNAKRSEKSSGWRSRKEGTSWCGWGEE